jgi:hypothetical protein
MEQQSHKRWLTLSPPHYQQQKQQQHQHQMEDIQEQLQNVAADIVKVEQTIERVNH